MRQETHSLTRPLCQSDVSLLALLLFERRHTFLCLTLRPLPLVSSYYSPFLFQEGAKLMNEEMRLYTTVFGFYSDDQLFRVFFRVEHTWLINDSESNKAHGKRLCPTAKQTKVPIFLCLVLSRRQTSLLLCTLLASSCLSPLPIRYYALHKAHTFD